MPEGMDANGGRSARERSHGRVNSGSRRRSALEMLVCVLLVAALAGQPAWGDGKSGKPPGAGAQSTANSGNQTSTGKAGSGTAKATRTSSAKAKKTSGAKRRKAGAKGNAKQKSTARKAKKTSRAKAKKKKARQIRKRQAEETPAPAPEPPPAPEDLPDPTPTPESEPPPVETGLPDAPPEAETPPPAPVTEAPPEAVPSAPGQPEPPAPAPGAAPPTAPLEPIGKASPAEPETATPGSVDKVTVAPTIPSEDQPTTGSGEPEGPIADERPTVGGPPEQTPNGEGPSAQNGGTLPGSLPTAAGSAGIPANPIVAGTTLLPAARDLVTQRPGTETSRAQGRDASGVGRLQPPNSLGVNQVADFVKDIPAQIKLAIAGLALLVLLLGAYSVLTAGRTRRLERQRSKLMEDIGLLQAALLPAVPGRLGALLTTVAYRPADGPGAGGDFYDAFALSDGRVGLLLGDISGHGRQALAKTTLVRFTVRAHLEAGMSPREALAISGRSLDGRLADDFSTVIAALHDPVKGTLTYASAGHPPPLVVGPQAHQPVTASSAPPIGAGFPTGQRQTVLPMPEGATVCVYSDGLLEARIDGEALGRDRLGGWLENLGPEATAKALLDLVVQRADRVPDDLAACVIHAAPGATAPAARVEQLKLDVLDVEGPELDGFLRACGVSRADRAIAGRRVSEQLAVSGGVVVEVRIGEHPMVSVASIGDHASGGARPASRVR